MPGPARIVHIHAGLPKTGSSALQVFLRDNRAQLATAGLYVPGTGYTFAGNHHHLVTAFGGPDPLARRRMLGRLVREIEGAAGEVLLSSEFVPLMLRYGAATPAFRALAARGFTLRFHVFVRPQTDFATSAHPEFLRNLLLPQPFRPFVDRNFLPFAQDYGAILSQMEALSPGNVSVLPYRRGTRVWWDLLDSVGLTLAGDARAALSPPGRVNPSLGAVGTAALMTALQGIEADARLRRFTVRNRVRKLMLLRTGRFAAGDIAYNPLTPESRAAMWSQCAAANDAVAHRYWHRPWDAVFADEAQDRPALSVFDPSAHDPDDPARLRHDAIARAMRDLMTARLDDLAAGRGIRRLIGGPVDRVADAILRRRLVG